MVDWLLKNINCRQFLINREMCREPVDVKMLSKVTLALFFLSGLTVSVLLSVYPNYAQLFSSKTPPLDFSDTSTWNYRKTVKSLKGNLSPRSQYPHTAMTPVKKKRSDTSPGNVIPHH